MKLRYLSLLLLLALVFVPGDIVSAETTEATTESNVDEENSLKDDSGHFMKGYISWDYTQYDSSDKPIRYVIKNWDLEISEPGYFYFVKKISGSSETYVLYGKTGVSINYSYFEKFEGTDGNVTTDDKSGIYQYGPYVNDNGTENTGAGKALIVTSDSFVGSVSSNIPIFSEGDYESVLAYQNSGDYSGAENADDVNDAWTPKNEYANMDGPWLKMGNFDGSDLTIRPVENARCSWDYIPQNIEDFTDVRLDVVYDYQFSVEKLGNARLGETKYFTYSEQFPLSTCKNTFVCYPSKVFTHANWFSSQEALIFMFGGKMSVNMGVSLGFSSSGSFDGYEVTGSFLTVTFKLKGKKNGDNWVNGPAYVEKVDLLNRTCTENEAYSDVDGNYTVDESSPSKTTDENGNVVINNNINTGGTTSGSGGNANVTIGDITTSSTFRFPDKITVDLNINGLDGTGGGGSSGSSEDGSKKWYDRLLDALSSLLEFLTGAVTKLFEALGDLLTTFAESVGDFVQYLFEGFGLFSGDMDDLLAESYSFLPPDVWRLIMFGIATVILTAVVKKFFGS